MYHKWPNYSWVGQFYFNLFKGARSGLYRCNIFEVQCISDIIDQYKLQSLIGSGSRPPDHSLIVIYFIIDNVADNKSGPDNSIIKKKYLFKETPECFMSSPNWRTVVSEILKRIEYLEIQQAPFDALYDDLCKSVFLEIDDHIRYSDSTKTIRKKFKNYKPYWSNELTKLWQEMSKS